MNLKGQVLSALAIAHGDLIAGMREGHWEGRLSSSALSTATAISALATVGKCALDDPARQSLIAEKMQRGIAWLVRQQLPDGGFGDTDKSRSNISTTMLAVAALRLSAAADHWPQVLARAQAFVEAHGSVQGIRRRYGGDKTFAVPILANAALAGLIPWQNVSALPFEAACLPQQWYRFAQLPVVSYAIPAMVAIGQAKFHFDPPKNPLLRWIRRASIERSLRVLERMQPESGGYLEAIPLTSFVVMSLVAIGREKNPVTPRGVDFLLQTQRPDGAWPIDTNLATWTTTLATLAVHSASHFVGGLPEINLHWILDCQNQTPHPFTGAAPGGWGWSNLSGAVPDADDTPAALLALKALKPTWRGSPDADRTKHQIDAGIRWLIDLQNRNGGWPTFCRGWGKLPFDRSGSDLTAHALRALHAWRDLGTSRAAHAIVRGLAYLGKQQRADGSWLPLWFGNQDQVDDENPIYGTSKVLSAYRDLGLLDCSAAQRGAHWLLAQQNADGGWGGGASVAWFAPELGISTVEETALATEALGEFADRENFAIAFERGAKWLVSAVGNGFHKVPSPIGLYFAKLWYYEDLYPLIFTVSALSRAALRLERANQSTTSPSF